MSQKIKHDVIALVSMFTLALSACKTRGDSKVQEAPPSAPTASLACNTSPHSESDPKVPYGPTCDDLHKKFPMILDDQPPEDRRVLCPFLRMVKRSEAWQSEIASQVSKSAALIPVSVKGLLEKAVVFGCSDMSCRPVAKFVSAGQQGKDPQSVTDTDLVDLGSLHKAKGTAHDCGFTFGLGDTEVNPAVREQTLKNFKDLAKDGRLQLQDLFAVKNASCKRDYEQAKKMNLPTINPKNEGKETLDLTPADTTEIGLIYKYLGGVDNGYILVSDVEFLFSARMPRNKTKYFIDPALAPFVKL